MSKIVEQHIACPECPSSDGYCTYDDGHGYCYVCNHYKPPDNKLDDSIFSYEYLPWRGLTKETLQKYNIKTKIDVEGKPVSVGFEYPNLSYKIKSLIIPKKEDGHIYSKGPINEAGLFGENKFGAGSNKFITITEGELDAASYWQVLRSPVVSVHSSSSAVRDCSRARSYLNSFERIYLAFDNDAAGREAASKVAKLFDYNKLYTVKFSKYKDANEYLQHGETDELRNIWHNAKKYLPETVISSFHEFEKILAEETKTGIPWPFPTLNYMTYGIRTGESVLVTAPSGVGKTEFMHATEHKVLKETPDDVCVAAIFLEEPKRRHLQALGGIELQKPVHLPDSGATSSEIYSALTQVVRSDDRLHVYSHFGSDDPEVLIDTIRFLVSARNCRYVFFDHITMAVSGLGGEDERRALDYLSTRLEMLVKELDFALIFVSHVNDNGQTRGSRNIRNIADLQINLERDLTNDDPVIRRTTKLSISKNRFCGRTGPAGNLIFNPATYTLTEDIGDAEASDFISSGNIKEMAFLGGSDNPGLSLRLN